MTLICKIITHRCTTVIETATFSKSESFYECSRCGLKEPSRISESGGLIVRKGSKEIICRPKENDYFKLGVEDPEDIIYGFEATPTTYKSKFNIRR